MKSFNLFFLSFFILPFAIASQSNNPDNEKLKNEVNQTIEKIFEGWNELDVDRAFVQNFLKPNYSYMGVRGNSWSYDNMLQEASNVFSSFTGGKFTITEKQTKIINPTVAVVVLIYDGEFYNNNNVFKYPNVGCTFVLVKKEGKWLVTHFHESTQLPSGA